MADGARISKAVSLDDAIERARELFPDSPHSEFRVRPNPDPTTVSAARDAFSRGDYITSEELLGEIQSNPRHEG